MGAIQSKGSAPMEPGYLVDLIARLLTNASARDKVFRSGRYLARVLIVHLSQRDPKNQLINNLEGFSSGLSLGRRMTRLGLFFVSYQSLCKAFSIPDTILRTLVTLKNICDILFSVGDGLCWAGKVKAMNVDAGFWSDNSNVWWFFSLVINAIACLRRIASGRLQQIQCIQQITELQSKMNNSPEDKDSNSKHDALLAQLETLRQNQKREILDLIKSILDIPLAFEAGFKKGLFNNFTVAYCGTITSLLGLYISWPSPASTSASRPSLPI